MFRPRSMEQVEGARAAFVELRVHGVSGTPPEELLRTNEVEQVRGDEVAGFFRPSRPWTARHGVSNGHDNGRPRVEEAVEAYSWGGLTSRGWTRALWVLLAPFALVNVAGWMLPPRDPASPRWMRVVAEGAIRLLALHVTVMVAMWTGQITMEFIAYQCGGSAACAGGGWWLALFGAVPDWAPGVRLAVGALTPLVVIGLLWVFGTVSRGRYEARFVDEGAEGDDANTFADPGLWQRTEQLRGLARLHIAGAVAVIAYQVSVSTAWVHQQTGDVPALLVATGRLALIALLVVAMLVAVFDVSSGRTGPVEEPPTAPAVDEDTAVLGVDGTAPKQVSAGATISVLVAAWVTVALAVGAGMGTPGTDPVGLAEQGMRLERYGHSAAFGAVIALVTGVVLALAMAGLRRRRTAEVRLPSRDGSGTTEVRVGFAGWGALAAVLLGYGLASLILLGAASWTARVLSGEEWAVDHPAAYDASAVVGLVLLVLVAPVALAASWRRRRRDLDDLSDDQRRAYHPEDLRGYADRYASETTGLSEKARDAWIARVRRAWVFRLFFRDIDGPIAVFLVVGALLLVPVALLPAVGMDLATPIVDWTWPWVDTAAVWVVSVGVPLALVLLVRRTFASSLARRQVGVLWDVLTFWPRWYHPLAPPAYSTRAVPELQTRLKVLTGEGADVVVSAHSQGSVIALAALDGLRASGRGLELPVLPRVALLTHGSPITRLYLTYFPAHLAVPIQRVARELDVHGNAPRWVNLYRATDPIGGAIAGEVATLDPRSVERFPSEDRALDVLLPDPDLEGARDPIGPFPRPGDPYPSPRGHSGHDMDAVYDEVVTRLRERLDERDRSAPEAFGDDLLR